jgi:hypothetical protein
LDHDIICVAEYGEALASNFTEYANGETRTRERVSPNGLGINAESDAELSDLILEQLTERLK